MLKKIGIALGLLVALFAVAMATRPDRYRVERSVTIAAPPEVVFGYVNDFHKWAEWSPFEKLDPAMQRTFDGPTEGVGARYAWKGNSQAGAGSMLITESARGERIALDLHFLAPLESKAVTEFTFQPGPEGTTVTWAMSGESSVMSRALEVVSSMDAMVGGEFAKGLATLKQISEAEGRRLAAFTSPLPPAIGTAPAAK